MTAVLGRMSDIDAANVTRCARVLLRRPLLRQGAPDGDLLPLIHRHRAALADLFSELLGYRLVVERRYARLYKTGPGADATRGEPSLSPRGYAHLSLAVACLTGVGPQVLLSRLVGDIRAAAVEAGLDIPDTLPERRAMAAALRHLIGLGVITETEGSVTGLTGEGGEALITIDTDLLGQLIAGPLTAADSAEELIALASRPGPRGVEHTMRRRLVENPVVLYADLTGEEASWLRSRQRRESLTLDRAFGLATETRLEGIAVTDPEEYLTDLAFPGPGTVARITLLALPALLGDSEPDEHGRHPVPRSRIREVCAAIVEDYPAAWSRQATENLDVLVEDVMDLAHRLGLLADTPATGGTDPVHDQIILLNPVAHRWLPRPDAPTGPPPSTPVEPVVDDTLSLFETDLTGPIDDDPDEGASTSGCPAGHDPDGGLPATRPSTAPPDRPIEKEEAW